MQEIQLVHEVDDSKIQLLKSGLSYYSWVKSNRTNRYYLFYSEKIQRRKEVLIKILVVLLTALSAVLICRNDFFPFMILGPIMLLFSFTAIVLFQRQRNKIKMQLSSKSIAVFDLDNYCLIIRNITHLPFIQTRERRHIFFIKDIKNLECDSAYRINNKGVVIWDRTSYVPSWNALYINGNQTEKQQRSMLFVGNKIPLRLRLFFSDTMSLSMEYKADFSRWE